MNTPTILYKLGNNKFLCTAVHNDCLLWWNTPHDDNYAFNNQHKQNYKKLFFLYLFIIIGCNYFSKNINIHFTYNSITFCVILILLLYCCLLLKVENTIIIVVFWVKYLVSR